MAKPPLTVEEAKQMYKGRRRLEIDVDENGFVRTVSYREPCMLCGKYHHHNSKAQRRCSLKIVCGVYTVINSEQLNQK